MKFLRTLFSSTDADGRLGWFGIVRLGMVQTALGGIVVLSTSTLNRVMVVELALPALLPGLLVALHFAVQVARPRWGYGSDVGGRSTPFIIGGMATLAAGGALAALATAWMASNVALALMLATLAYLMIGIGVGAAGTNLLVLLAKRVAPERRAAAATIVWIMMIVGFIVTAGTVGSLLDPFTLKRLVIIATVVSAVAFVIAVAAVWGIEGETAAAAPAVSQAKATVPFRQALAEVWSEPEARHFTIFVFVSMVAYSAQDLILEPFAGEIFGYTPGETTKLSGVQHGGVLAGMLLVAVTGSLLPAAWRLSLKTWTLGGCAASAVVLGMIAASGLLPPPISFNSLVFLLGVSNGAFAIAAIGSMMTLAGRGREAREGVRMGLWGAAQAIAFGSGGLIGAAAVDVFRLLIGRGALPYVAVFALEALLFVAAALIARRIGEAQRFGAADTGARATDIGATLWSQPSQERRI